MLEESCHLLDIKISCHQAIKDGTLKEEELDKYVTISSDIQENIKKADQLKEKIQLVEEAMLSATLKEPENEIKIKSIYMPRIDHLNKKRIEKVNKLKTKKCFIT